MSPTRGTPNARLPRSIPATTPVWLVGALAAVAAAIVTELFALGARAIGVSMEAGALGADTAEPIPLGGFAVGTLMWSVVGIILAVILARWAKRPARTFVVTTVALTALSLAGPVMAVDTVTTTKVVLVLSHLVAAVVVISPLALRLSHTRR